MLELCFMEKRKRNIRMKYDTKGFKWSEEKGLWHNATVNRPPSVMINKDRMVHVGPGKQDYGFNWAGSTLTDWHCITDMSFDKAVEWVKGTEDDPKHTKWFRENVVENVMNNTFTVAWRCPNKVKG